MERSGHLSNIVSIECMFEEESMIGYARPCAHTTRGGTLLECIRYEAAKIPKERGKSVFPNSASRTCCSSRTTVSEVQNTQPLNPHVSVIYICTYILFYNMCSMGKESVSAKRP